MSAPDHDIVLGVTPEQLRDLPDDIEGKEERGSRRQWK